MFVYSGADSVDAQSLDGDISMGARAPYQRGVNTFLQAILAWRYLAYIRNRTTGEDGSLRTDAPTEEVHDRDLGRKAMPFHYYVGRK